MRNKLIQKIIDLSVKYDQDDLSWVKWSEKSNDELLEIYVGQRIEEFIFNGENSES